MSSPAIEIEGLTRSFGDRVVVDHIDLTVATGEFFGFLGPNGAGKSTTLHMLVGLLRPDSGTARLQGVDAWTHPLEAKRLRGVVPEGLALYERLTAREYVRLVGTLYGLESDVAERRTAELLDLLDLAGDADRLLVDFSHGMQKKTALAAAVVHAPPILFLDEPFEGVDAVSRRVMHDVLQGLRARGATIFFSSHYLELVERLCTRMAVITEGRIAACGTMAELRARAHTGDDATLEDVFLRTVSAGPGRDDVMSWLD